MKKMAKRLMILTLALLMVFAFAACTPANKAEKAVKDFIEAVKKGDVKKIRELKFVETEDSEDEETEETDEETEEFIKRATELIYKELDYKIVKTEEVDKEKAIVTVEITNVDGATAMGNVIAKFLEADAAEAEELSEKENNERIFKILEECLSDTNLEKVTSEVTVTVKLVDGKWRVDATKEFADAMTGGAGIAVESMM